MKRRRKSVFFTRVSTSVFQRLRLNEEKLSLFLFYNFSRHEKVVNLNLSESRRGFKRDFFHIRAQSIQVGFLEKHENGRLSVNTMMAAQGMPVLQLVSVSYTVSSQAYIRCGLNIDAGFFTNQHESYLFR